MTAKIFLIAAASLVCGCATTVELTTRAREVQLLESDPAQECVATGKVTTLVRYGDDAVAKTILRNKAAAQGANSLRVTNHANDNGWIKYSGTSYKCPERF